MKLFIENKYVLKKGLALSCHSYECTLRFCCVSVYAYNACVLISRFFGRKST